MPEQSSKRMVLLYPIPVVLEAGLAMELTPGSWSFAPHSDCNHRIYLNTVGGSMRASHRVGIFSLALLFLLVFAASEMKKPRIMGRAAALTICSDKTEAVCSLNPPDSHDQAALDKFGVDLVNALAGHGDPNNSNAPYDPPKWEHWANKCDVGLLSKDICPAPDTLFDIDFKKGDRENRRLPLSFFRPVQRELDTAPKSHKEGEQPQLASVLYNGIAADFIKNQMKIAPGSVSIPKLPAGSVITKAIWALVSKNIDQTLYVTDFTPETERIETGDSFINPPTKGGDNPHFSAVALDLSSAQKCEKSYSASTPMTITSGDCIHLYKEVKNIPITNQYPADFQHNCNPECVVALVGLQFMVRTRKDDNWIWISVWWTGRDNGKLKNAPWKYYTVDVTNTARSIRTGKDGNQMNIIFNPYLEGVTPPNGANSNCVNCHSYAAFDATTGFSKSSMGVDPAHGGPPLPTIASPQDIPPLSLPTPSSPIQAGDYLDQSVQTDFLWSIADKTQPPSLLANQKLTHHK
jgi:hypothetical protein